MKSSSEDYLEYQIDNLIIKYEERHKLQNRGCSKCNKEIHALILGDNHTTRLCEEHYVILKTNRQTLT